MVSVRCAVGALEHCVEQFSQAVASVLRHATSLALMAP